MAFFGTRLRELHRSLTKKPSRVQAPVPPRVTPPGNAIAGLIEILVVVLAAGILAKGIGVWVHLFVPERLANTTVGFVWALASSIAINELHSSVRKHISIARHLAPYVGHRLYRTYRAIRYGRA